MLDAYMGSPGPPLWLRTSVRLDARACAEESRRGLTDPGLAIHPEHGIPDGARVRVSTRYGSVETVAHHEPELRTDCIDLPYGYGVDVMALLSGARLDSLCGTAALDGVACRVELCS